MYVKQAHCVSMTRMFCCVTENSLRPLSPIVKISYYDAVCVETTDVRASDEADKSSVMIWLFRGSGQQSLKT